MTFTYVEIRAGRSRRARGFADDVERAVEEVAPAVEEVTGLAVTRVRLRLVDHRAMPNAAHRARCDQLARDVEELGMGWGSGEVRHVAASLAAMHAREKRSALLRQAQIVHDEHGPEIQIHPRACRWAGIGKDGLRRILARQLVHIGQCAVYEAANRSPETLALLHDSRFTLRRRSDHLALRPVMEGQACWA